MGQIIEYIPGKSQLRLLCATGRIATRAREGGRQRRHGLLTARP